MEIIWILLILAVIIVAAVVCKNNRRRYEEKEAKLQHEDYEILRVRYKNELEKEEANAIKSFNAQYKRLQNVNEDLGIQTAQLNKIKEEISKRCDELNNLSTQIQTKEEYTNKLIDQRRSAATAQLEQEIKYKKEQVSQEIDTWSKDAWMRAADEYLEEKDNYDNLILAKQSELTDIVESIQEQKKKQDVINQEILRRREIEENQTFYRVNLPENIISDIRIINTVKNQLSKIDLFDKLIYDNYIKKYADEMIKRVLNGEAPSGIYKITRLSTGEVYVGKSTDIKARWQQHIKSAFHCGTISHALIHSKMEEDGVQNFTWELIEKVPKEKLTEREKYWIQYYDTMTYGLNMREG